MSSTRTPHETAKQFAVWFVIPSLLASCHIFIRRGPEEGIFAILANLIVFPSIGYVVGYIYRLAFNGQQVVLNDSTSTATSPNLSAPPANPTAPIQRVSIPKEVLNTPSSESRVMQDTPLSTEEDHWAAAMAEIESGQRRPGIWAKAFAESDGDETKAKVAYLKARVAQLTAASSAESDARKEARDKERQRIAVEESLQFNIDQFKRNAWLSDEALRSVIAQAEHSILRSVTVDATGDTLLHLCSKRGLELEVRNLVAAGADQEKLNSQGKTAADFSTSEAVLLLLYGLAVFREDANKTRVVDVPASILKIKADLAKKNYIVEGGTIKEPFGAKVRVKSDIDFLEYAHSKLQS